VINGEALAAQLKDEGATKSLVKSSNELMAVLAFKSASLLQAAQVEMER
jgi:hypothetical protein